MTGRVATTLFVSAIALAAGCGGRPPAAQASPPVGGPATSSAASVPSISSTRASAPSVPALQDGPITPGTYFYVPEAGAPGIEVTVPSSRWEAATEFRAMWPRSGGSRSGALVMGWTTTSVGLNSEPCSQSSHQATDLDVGPGVDDFVEAVVAHPALDINEPVDVELGGFSGRSFTLTTPADQGGCEEWRPWDPGFYAQGPGNIWDVWVIDVHGFRILIVAEYFPATPDELRTELRSMVESIRFVP